MLFFISSPDLIVDNLSYVFQCNAKFFIQSYSTGAIKETEKTKLKLCGGVKLAVKFDVEARIFPDTEKE